MSDGPDPVAGWYPDVEVPGGERYWDGTAWTEHRRPAAGTGSPWGPQAVGQPSWSVAAPTPQLDTWLWQSIVATLVCCQPLGIVGIVMSALAGAARDAGNWPLAQKRADQARTWTLAAVGVGLFIIFGFVGLGALGAFFGG